MPKKSDGWFAIWWLSGSACKDVWHLLEGERIKLPKWIVSEVGALVGSAGGGRLWVSAKQTGLPSGISWNAKAPLEILCLKAGGIMIRDKDVPKVISLPGFVTDINLIQWKI